MLVLLAAPALCLWPAVSSQVIASQRPRLQSSVEWVNPLAIDNFYECGGWGNHADRGALPLLVFLPGMDGSLLTPFMQYPELGSRFEIACMRHVGGLASRASFAELTEDCASFIRAQTSARQVVLVGESFGATLALGAIARLVYNGAEPM
jgi:hypothetical protein